MQIKWRKQRMREFCSRMGLRHGMRIIDVGGRPDMWDFCDLKLEITLLNLPTETASWQTVAEEKGFTVITGDACDPNIVKQHSLQFDVVFCNSVIEHVSINQRIAFAQNIQQLAPAWWVQTPSNRFPLEAHCNLPFWWHYPQPLKNWWHKHWRKRQHYFIDNLMQHTTVLSRNEMATLFKGSNIYNEHYLGLEKSYSFYNSCE